MKENYSQQGISIIARNLATTLIQTVSTRKLIKTHLMC